MPQASAPSPFSSTREAHMNRKAAAPIPSTDHSHVIAELRAAKARIASRLTGAGYTLADRIIDSHAAAKRGMSASRMRLIRASTEVEAIDEAIRALGGQP